MRKGIFLIIVALCILACNSNNDKNYIKKEHLAGVWFFGKANKIDNGFQNFEALLSEELDEGSPILNIIEFDNKRTVWMDTGGIAPLEGDYTIKDSSISMTFKGNTIADLKFDAMPTMDTARYRWYRRYKGTTDFVVYEITRQRNISAKTNKWREPLPENATEKQIKTKLKEMLTYYVAYGTLIHKYNNQFFKATRFNLPFDFYSGGVGLVKPEKWDAEFRAIIGGEQNQKVTYKILEDLFKLDYSYPYLSSLLLEYNDFFNHCSRNL